MIRKINRETLLEKRITRLENIIKNERRSVTRRTRKFESFESDLVEDEDNASAITDRARAAANRIAAQFGRMIGENIVPDSLGSSVILSPSYGWISADQFDEISDDHQYARFAFQYNIKGTDFYILVFPTENSVELMCDGYAVDTDGNEFEGEDWYDDAYSLNEWKGFNLSMVNRDEW